MVGWWKQTKKRGGGRIREPNGDPFSSTLKVDDDKDLRASSTSFSFGTHWLLWTLLSIFDILLCAVDFWKDERQKNKKRRTRTRRRGKNFAVGLTRCSSFIICRIFFPPLSLLVGGKRFDFVPSRTRRLAISTVDVPILKLLYIFHSSDSCVVFFSHLPFYHPGSF